MKHREFPIHSPPMAATESHRARMQEIRERRGDFEFGFNASGFDFEKIAAFDREQFISMMRQPHFAEELMIATFEDIARLLLYMAAIVRKAPVSIQESLPNGVLSEFVARIEEAGTQFQKDIVYAHIAEAMWLFLGASGGLEKVHPEWHGDYAAYAVWKIFCEEILPKVPPSASTIIVRLYGGLERYPEQVRENFAFDIAPWLDPDRILSRQWSAVRDVPAFLDLFGEDGLRAFNAVSWKREARNAIFDIARKLESATAKQLFHAFAELLRESHSAFQIVRHAALRADASISETELFAIGAGAWQTLQMKAVNMLMDAARDVNAQEVRYTRDRNTEAGDLHVETNDIARRLTAELSILRTSIAARAASFKALSEAKIISSLEDMKGFDMRVMSAAELTPEMRAEMSAIFSVNRKNYPERLRAISESGFQDVLYAGGRFYVLQFKGDVVAFMRFEERPDGALYAGSLNVRPEARGSAVGSAMLREVLVELGRDHDIVAEAYSKNPMLKHYQEEWGFNITGEVPDWHESGELFYEMRRPAGGKPLEKVA